MDVEFFFSSNYPKCYGLLGRWAKEIVGFWGCFGMYVILAKKLHHCESLEHDFESISNFFYKKLASKLGILEEYIFC